MAAVVTGHISGDKVGSGMGCGRVAAVAATVTGLRSVDKVVSGVGCGRVAEALVAAAVKDRC